jgi:squalene-hopene/tetraprenyl-beta-curcumene cyclase
MKETFPVTRRVSNAVVLAVVAGLALLPANAGARRAGAADVGPDPKDVQAMRDRAVAYLKAHQGADGSFSPRLAGPGVTAVVVAGLLRNGHSPDDPLVARGLAYMQKSVKKDGGIYDRRMANYTTSVALMAFQEANPGGKYDALIQNATRFLKRLQAADDPNDPRYGGVGYGAKDRPDLSNTQYFLDALSSAGVPKDDPAVQRALRFVSRCQNLPGETNDQPFAKKTSDDDRGGLTYLPLDSDDNPHKTPEGGLRSLGAMTYAGLKSFLYAGVSKDDPRVKGALHWIRRHYTLDENPNMGQAGLYYYYHTFAKAMAALGQDHFEDAKGTRHDWRQELFEALKKRQRPDGSFINRGDRAFGEADPNLSTGFALLTLSYTQKK